MSLAERVSSLEDYDRWSRRSSMSPAGSQRRKLSFNPVQTLVPEHKAEVPVGAFEVSKAKRIGE